MTCEERIHVREGFEISCNSGDKIVFLNVQEQLQNLEDGFEKKIAIHKLS